MIRQITFEQHTDQNLIRTYRVKRLLNVTWLSIGMVYSSNEFHEQFDKKSREEDYIDIIIE